MKQIRRRTASSLYSFPLLFFVLVLVVAGSYLLALTGFEGVFKATLFNTPQGILLLVVGPLVLIAFLGIFLFGIVSDSLRRYSSNRFAGRVFISFCFVILLSAVPQTLIIGQFVCAALDTWFSPSVSRSLFAAGEIADLYTAERYRTIETVADRYLTGLSITNWQSRQVDWMPTIRTMDPEAAACQVYFYDENGDGRLPEYTPLIESGDSTAFVPRERLDMVQDGIFALEGDEDVFRYGQIVHYGNSVYSCVYTSRMPAGFEERLSSIHGAQEQARIINTLDPFLPYMGIWIFTMFCLPSLLMVIIIAFHMSSLLSDPVMALQEAAERLAAGDSSFRLVPHTGDELAETALIINSISESGSPSKKRDKKAVIRL